MIEQELIRVAESFSIPQMIKGKTVVVTGASGLIGSYLSALISCAGGRVIAISTSGRHIPFAKGDVTYFRADVTKGFPREITEADYIVHAASPANPKAFDKDPIGVIFANVQGTANALDLARRTGAKLLFASSSEVYGENIYGRALKESDAGTVDSLSPRSCYTESKRLAENLCINYDRQFGTQSIVARIAFCYGGNFGLQDNRVVPQFVRMALNDGAIIMQSSGAMCRSYIYVADVAAAIIKLLASDFTGAVNIATDEIVSIKQIAESVCLVTNARLEIDKRYLENAQGVSPFSGCVLDCEKLKGLGFVPIFDLAKGIASTIEIYKEMNL